MRVRPCLLFLPAPAAPCQPTQATSAKTASGCSPRMPSSRVPSSLCLQPGAAKQAPLGKELSSLPSGAGGWQRHGAT